MDENLFRKFDMNQPTRWHFEDLSRFERRRI